ncbi:MAG TPA: tetratricopeptide repeat-containing sensor histidine kinase [Chryseolinea sp.]|nr:tetratricopeptide repeat-containing sensor histidine kinase [Chryseolinea sp.]
MLIILFKRILKITCVTYFLKAVKALSFIAVLLFSAHVQAQDQSKIDSLLSLLETSRDLKTIMAANIELSWHLIGVEDSLACKYSAEGLKYAWQFGDSVKIVKAGRILGQSLRRLDKPHESIEILTQVLPISRRNNIIDEQKKILNGLALAYTYQAVYDKALEYNFQSLILREADGIKEEISVTLNNIGLVYFKLHNYESALKYYNDCVALKLEANYLADLDMIYLNIGLCYLHLHKFSEAKEFTLKGLAFCGDHCSSEITMMGEYGLGEASYWLRDWSTAEGHLSKSLEIARRDNDTRWQGENLVYLGALYYETKKYAKAISTLVAADSIAAIGGYNQIMIESYKHLAALYNTTREFEKASEFQNKLIELSDSLIGRELVTSIGKIQANYEERENIATIASNEVVIKQARDFNVAVTVIAMLTGLLFLVVQFGNRNIKRVNAKLSEAKEVIQRQNKELEYKNRELDIEVDRKTIDLARVNTSLKQVNDELDNFIYKTSHDIRGPLASLKGMCNVALMDVKDPIALEYLRKLDATAERLNSILTRLVIINQINNSKLTVKSVDFKSIVNDVMLLEKKKGLPPDLTVNIQIDNNIDIESDRELVRIVLENLIDNAIKFYNDSDRVNSFINVSVSSLDNGGAKVRVVDNGIGISEASPGKLFQMFSRASERSETGGIGLYITKTATEKIGGRVGLLTTPEGHTEFYVLFPRTPFAEMERLERRLG